MRVSLVLIVILVVGLAGLGGCATLTAQKKAPPLGQLIETPQGRMHVVDMGPRDSALAPVVLIHGASVNLRDLKMSLGDRLAEERRVILIDRPGRGYSERPENGYQLNVQAAAINAVIEALGVDNPLVIGQSLGGAVALTYALEYQTDMSGLVLLAPVSHEWPGGIAWYNEVSSWPVAGELLRRLVIPVYGTLVAEDGIKKSFAPDTPPENYYERSGLSLLFRANDFKSNAADVEHLKAQIIAQQNRYGELELPVAIVTGEDDTTVSPELHSKALARDIAGATLTLLPDTGHALHHAETETILMIIRGMPAS